MDVNDGVAKGPLNDCQYDNNANGHINISTPEQACNAAFDYEDSTVNDWSVSECGNLGQWTFYECSIRNYETSIISFGSVSSDYAEILYQTTQPIGGFQFTISGANIDSAFGGVADAYGFEVLVGPSNNVIGYSLDSFIPIGGGILTNLSFASDNNQGSSICIEDLVVSDTSGTSSLNFATGEGSSCFDADNDDICDDIDQCPNDSNNDIDGDGICGDVDECPNDADNDIDKYGICGDVDA